MDCIRYPLPENYELTIVLRDDMAELSGGYAEPYADGFAFEIMELILKVEAVDADLAAGLTQRLDNYDYNGMKTLLDEFND